MIYSYLHRISLYGLVWASLISLPLLVFSATDSTSMNQRGIGYHEQIIELLPDKPQQADSLARIMLQMFRGAGDTLEALSYFDIGEAAYYSGQYDTAGIYYQKSIALFDSLKNFPRLINLYNNLGLTYYFGTHYKEALEACTHAAELAQKYGTELQFAESLHNTALVHERAGNIESARTYFENSLMILENGTYSFEEASLCNDFASFLKVQKDYDRSEQLYKRALKLFKDTGYQKEEYSVNVNLGSLYLSESNLKKAEFYFLKAKDYFETIQDKRALLSVYSLLGDLYFKKDEGVRSLRYYNRVEEMSKDMNLIYIRHKNLYSLYLVLKSVGRYPEALETMEVYNHLKDSLAAQSRSYAMSMAGDMLERQLIEKELNLYRARIRERSLIILSLVLLVLLLAALSFIYVRHQRLIKEREKNVLKHRLLLNQMNPHFVFNALNALQGLLLEDKKDEVFDYLQDHALLMRQMLEASSNELITLKKEMDFLRNFFKVQCRRFAVTIACDILSEHSPEDDELLLVPPMLTQPLIENAFEHARFQDQESPRLTVAYKKLEDSLQVTVEDNGVGYETAKAEAQGGGHKPFGMHIVEERLVLLHKLYKGGRSNIEITDLSSKGKHGTQVRFWLPLIYKEK